MASTFSGLQTAYSGLAAAQNALNVTGQNIANAGTAGYTRQTLTAQSAVAANQATMATLPIAQPGQGVVVTGVARLSDQLLNSSLRAATGLSGYADELSNQLSTLETGLGEPSSTGLSSQLQSFWSSWQDLANTPSQTSTAQVVQSQAQTLVSSISAGYTAVDQQWQGLRTQVGTLAASLNSDADQVGKLNAAIQQTTAAGGSANELMDQRDLLTAQIAQIAGGTVTQNSDGTVNVLLGGNLLVSGSIVNHVQVTGATDVSGAASSPVQLEWTQHPGQPIGIDSGQLAADLSLLAPAGPSGTGGALAQAAASYNQLATTLAGQVNGVLATGTTPSGAVGTPLFSFAGTGPAATALTVAITDPSQIATGAAGAGANDGTIADQISQLGTAAGSPDSVWASLVSYAGTTAQNASRQQTVADANLQTATQAQQSTSSVSTDQEMLNMTVEQNAYSAAARVMTTLDQMLNTLITETGTVGIN